MLRLVLWSFLLLGCASQLGNVGGTTLGTECKEAILPELGIGIQRQVCVLDKGALRMTLRQEGKQFS